MADKGFDPSTMDQTPRYGIRYPAPDNLVRQAPEQFQTMATDIEGALADVDDRATDDARATIVRPTLDQLKTSTPVQGQIGYVYNDPVQDQNGLYVWTGSASETGQWVKISSGTTLTIVAQTYEELQSHTDVAEGSIGLVTNDPQATNNVTYIYAEGQWRRIPGDTGQTLVVNTWDQLKTTPGTLGQMAAITADEAGYNNTAAVNMGVPSNWQRLQTMPDGTPLANPTIGMTATDQSGSVTTNRALVMLQYDKIIRPYGKIRTSIGVKGNGNKNYTVTVTITMPSGITVKSVTPIHMQAGVHSQSGTAAIDIDDDVIPTVSGSKITVSATFKKEDGTYNKASAVLDLSNTLIAIN